MFQSDWEFITTLFQEKNITKTASKIFMSQPAATKRLKSIEKEFGIIIVLRTPKGVIFTPAGIKLVEYSKNMLESYNNLKNEIATIESSRKKIIKVGVPNSFANKLLPKILGKFHEIYPRIEFEIVVGLSNEIADKLNNNEIDVAFVRGKHYLDKKSSFLFDEDIYLINSHEINFDNLINETFVEYENNMGFIIEKWWKENFTSSYKKTMKADRSDICVRIVAKGLGFSIVPELVLTNANEENIYKMKLLDKKGFPLKRVTKLFYSEEFSKLTIGKNFIDFIKQINFIDF